jgi:DNA topoisomerase IB
MPRLRRVSATSPGWRRRRAGSGFTYTDASGATLGKADVARIRALAIPPAWRDVWICAIENGHLQATGHDVAGRRQYLYHRDWRVRRDMAKHERVAEAARSLPRVRKRVERDLALPGMPLERAAAVAFRLLDLGYFRVGNDVYADANGSFGLTTLERRHVRKAGDGVVFQFVGKSGIEHSITITDPPAIAALEVMRRRRASSDRLLAYKGPKGWQDVTSTTVNDYLAKVFGGGFTAKDFRTWHAGVIAAESLALSDEPGLTVASRKRAVKTAVASVADYLGNTPTIAKSSYIDPRIIERYESGQTIAVRARRHHRSDQARRGDLEAALLDLLGY